MHLATRDECFSWRLAECGSVAEVIERSAADVHPPAYHIAVKYWTLLWGATDLTVLRAWSVVCAVFALAMCAWCTFSRPVALRAGKSDAADGRCAETRGGNSSVVDIKVASACALAAVLLLAGSPMQIDAALTARMYAPGVFLTFVSSWLLLALLDRPGSCVRGGAYVITATILAYTHYFGTIAVAAQLLGGWAHQFGRRQRVWPICLVGLAIGLLWMPWAPVFWRQFTQVQANYWIPPLTEREFVEQLAAWVCGNTEQTSGCLLVVLGSVAVLGLWQARATIHAIWLAQMVLPWYVSLMVYAVTGQSIFQLRYMVFAHAALAAQLGLIIGHLRPQRLRWLVVVALAATLMPTTADRIAQRRQESDLAVRQAFQYVRNEMKPGEHIRSRWYGEQNRARYYAAQAGIAQERVRCQRVSRVAGQGHVVHVASLDEIDYLQPGDEQRPYWLVEIYDRGYDGAGPRVFRSGDTVCVVWHSREVGAQPP